MILHFTQTNKIVLSSQKFLDELAGFKIHKYMAGEHIEFMLGEIHFEIPLFHCLFLLTTFFFKSVYCTY
jgi:hypothetical protein